MQAVTQGTIKHPAGQRFPSRYGGERVNVVVELPDGSEERIYGSPEELDGYNRGDAIALIRNKKGEWKPVAIESGPKLPKLPGNPPTRPTPGAIAPPPARKPIEWGDLRRDCLDLARIYAGCYRAARLQMPQDAPAEAVQACASSVWIAVSRRQHLDSDLYPIPTSDD